MERLDREKPKPGYPALLLAPTLILAALLLSPSSRSLVKTQFRLFFDADAFSDRVRDFHDTPTFQSTLQQWQKSRPAHLVAHFPEDYTLQVAGALLASRNRPNGRSVTPQQAYSNFQVDIGLSLAMIAQRFPNQPATYAHLLRFMSRGTVRLSRDSESQKYLGVSRPLMNRQNGYADSWAAFDQAAAQGERLDPDNAYFPMMRAMGLFDAKRDAEGIAAVLRAGQKKRFDDYAQEEAEAIQTLYRRTYGMETAVLRESDFAMVLLPHIAGLRSVARLVLAKAAQAEQAGRPQEGLALRHALMQCAARMREQGTLIGAMGGNGIFLVAIHAPGGVIEPPSAPNVDAAQKRLVQRDNYLLFLQHIGQGSEADWVLQEDRAHTATRDLIQMPDQSWPLYIPAADLHRLWAADMLLLANILALLSLCSAAMLLSRPQIRDGAKLLPWVVLGVMVFCLFTAFQLRWAMPMTQLQKTLTTMTSLSSAESPAQNAVPISARVSEFLTRYPTLVHAGEAFFSLVMPLLVLGVAGIGSLLHKETFAPALRRTLQRSALILLTCLTLIYACTLTATVRLERQANAIQDGRTQNAISYLQQLRHVGP